MQSKKELQRPGSKEHKHKTTSSLEFTEKIDAESLLKDFKIANLNNFNVYLQQLSSDFCSQSDNPGLGISKSTFLNFFSLPGIIGERLYSLFDLNNIEYIKVEDFINGMTNLYTGDFNYLCKFVFDLYDFDKDGLTTSDLSYSCSVVRNGNFIGRNFDYFFDNFCSFFRIFIYFIGSITISFCFCKN